MALTADEVYQAGLELEPDERTVVVHRLLASLHPEPDESQRDLDAAWRREVSVRLDGILNGRVEAGSFEETRTRACALLGDGRP